MKGWDQKQHQKVLTAQGDMTLETAVNTLSNALAESSKGSSDVTINDIEAKIGSLAEQLQKGAQINIGDVLGQ